MPATYNTNNLVKLGALQSLAQRTKNELGALDTKFSSAFRSMSVSGNTVSFFTSTDASGTAAATFDFPEEIFLDQLQTQFVSNFAFSAATYPGATDPNLDGKPVFVLAVKGDATINPTLTYSFVNVEYLVDTYTAADNTININGYTVNVKISAVANNAITVQSDGLHVDISGKVDKVEGKQISTNDYTDADKEKLGGISAGAQVNAIEIIKIDNVAQAISEKTVNISLSGKVDKVNGKDLSTNDFTDALKAKLDGIIEETITQADIDALFTAGGASDTQSGGGE